MKTLQQQLGKWKDKNQPKKKKQKKPEKLSSRDIRDLMGTNRSTYYRKKGGAFKQR